MTVGITVGFSPVQSTGAALPGAAGDGARVGGPLGAFQTLLAALAPQGDSDGFNPGGHGQKLDADGLAALLVTDEPVALVTADCTETLPAEALLTDLVRHLDLLQDALNQGRAPEPALEQEMDQTLAALAAALGGSIDNDPPTDARVGPTETHWLALTSARSTASVPAGAHAHSLSAPGSVSTVPSAAGTAPPYSPGTQPRALHIAATGAPDKDAPEVDTAAETRPQAGSGEAPSQAVSHPPRTASETIPAPSATPPTTPQAAQVQAVPPMAVRSSDTNAGRVPLPPAGPLTGVEANTAPAPQADVPPDATQRIAATPPAHPPNAGQALAHPLPGDTVASLSGTSAAEADPVREPAARDAVRRAATIETAAKPQGDGEAPLLVRLAERLTALAEAVKPSAPQLAQQLLALATRLNGMPDSGLAQKFTAMAGGDGDDGDLAASTLRLLPDTAPTRPLPAGEMLAAARLALAKLTGAHASDGASSTERPMAQPAPELRLEAAERPATDAQPRAPERPAAQASARGEPLPTPLPGSSAATAPDANQAQVAPPANAAAVTSADARALPAAYRPAGPQINLPQIAVEIVRQVNAGLSRFQIRLDPPELGRIDVKLEMDAAGKTVARMTVERPETLDLMQRDQRALERALAQAGLDSSKTSLEFALKQNPFGRDDHHRQHRQGDNVASGRQPDIEETEAPMPPPQITAYRGFASAPGVNLFV